MLYDNVLQTIGNTPIVRINNIGPDIQNIYAKLEAVSYTHLTLPTNREV